MPGGWAWDDDDEGAALDAANAVRQATRTAEVITEGLKDPGRFRLSRDVICELNRLAVEGRTEKPGELRTADVVITGSLHEPPPWADVPRLLDEMCQYVNDATDVDGVRLAAHVMWRVNWIHPFAEGNGRTARAVAYIVLSIGSGGEPPVRPRAALRDGGAELRGALGRRQSSGRFTPQ